MNAGASRMYVIGSADQPWVTIGISVDPQKRLKVLQAGSPFALSVLWHCEGDYTLEQHLHGVFKDHRMCGEWFDLTPLGDPVPVVREAVRTARAALWIPEPRTCPDPEGCWGGPCVHPSAHPIVVTLTG